MLAGELSRGMDTPTPFPTYHHHHHHEDRDNDDYNNDADADDKDNADKESIKVVKFLMPHRMPIRCSIISFLDGDGFDDGHSDADNKDKANDE